MPIGDTIKELRNDKKLTQEELANMLNCKRQKIADWERNKSTPSATDLILLAQKLDTTTDFILELTTVKTKSNKGLRFVCDYTGLSPKAITELQKGKNSVFNTTLLNFLINNKTLLKALNNYLLSSLYSEYTKSDYKYLPLKDNSIYTRFPKIAQKVTYSSLLEVLPLQKDKMTEKIKSDNALKKEMLFELAKIAVDTSKCEKLIDRRGYDEPTPEELEELEEYYKSEEYSKVQEEYYRDEIEDLETIEKWQEEEEIRNDMILWFLDKISKHKDGENNANNP